MVRGIIKSHRPLEANSARGRWVDLEDDLVPVQGQRDVVGYICQVREREQQIALRLKDDPTLFQELLECIAAHNALRHRSGHQIAASGLVADRDRERIGIEQRILGVGSSTAGSHDSHQLKPRIGLHDEGGGKGCTERTSTEYDVGEINERK